MKAWKNVAAMLVAIVAMAAIAAPAAVAGNIDTVVGNGAAGYAGDGGPAVAATLNIPCGLAIAADGTVYFADNTNFRIRRVDPSGIITTIVGTGDVGDADGPGTSATMTGVLAVALDPTGQTLYFGDIDNNRVRKLNLATGVVSNFAGSGFPGGFGFAGDNGPAALAKFKFLEGVAVNSAGDVYIADSLNYRIRKVTHATGIITTYVGTGASATSPDGLPAANSSIGTTSRLAFDAADNLYFIDWDRVRRVDAATTIVTTVAGGGSVIPGSGPATNMDIGHPTDIAVDAIGELYISVDESRVFKVNLATGQFSMLAGNGTADFGGDGGPAANALVNRPAGLAVAPATGALYVADTQNFRIRSIASDDLWISPGTSQAFLDLLLSHPGSVLMINVNGRTALVIPILTGVTGNVMIGGNSQLTIVDLGALQSVGGNITLTGNLALTSVDLSALHDVTGSLTISGNPNLTAILVQNVATIGGSFSIIGSAATVISLPGLTSTNGAVDVHDNGAATGIDLGSVTSVGGTVDVHDNGAATGIDFGSLTSVSGTVDVHDNGAATGIDFGSLTSVSGTVDVHDNGAATGIDLGALTSVGGAVDVSDNGPATGVDLGSLTTVGGSLTVETHGTGTFDVTGADVTQNTNLDATGYTTVSGTTAHGSTDVGMTNADAVMNVQIPGATFVTPVDFSVTRLDPAALPPVNGTAGDGSNAVVDPLRAYAFTFGVPTLNQDASLTFEVHVDALDGATRASFLEALAAGTVTLATQGDAPGSAYQAFPLCTGSQVPTVDGCVLVVLLDANGQPTAGTPAIVRFSNVVGHFSTWSVAIVTPHACVVESDGNPCTTDTCDPGTGAQVHAPVGSGTSCSDGNACNGAETCNGVGTCVAGTAVNCNDQNACTVDSCNTANGACSHQAVVLAAVGTVSFVSRTTLVWSTTPDATQWNTYAGTIPSGGLGSRPPGSTYDHSCFESGDAHGDGATTAVDPRSPAPRTGFYYLVSGRSACGESALGFSSSGAAIPNAAPCP